MTFVLDKWYLDCVTVEGTVVVAHWASLHWGGFAVTYRHLAVAAPGLESSARTSLRRAPAPHVRDGAITWRADRLGCRVEARSLQRPVRARLLDTAEGSVDWFCVAPAAAVTFEMSNRPTARGTGYVERMKLAVPPWRLPIDELRWGRWLGGGRSLVWVDWRGSEPRRWVYLDGALQAEADVTDDSVETGGLSLDLRGRRAFICRSLAEVLTPLPRLRSALPGWLLAATETRWLTQASLGSPSSSPVGGWAVHELVHFR